MEVWVKITNTQVSGWYDYNLSQYSVIHPKEGKLSLEIALLILSPENIGGIDKLVTVLVLNKSYKEDMLQRWCL